MADPNTTRVGQIGRCGPACESKSDLLLARALEEGGSLTIIPVISVT